MLRVVVDTNVIMSALLKPESKPDLILSLILSEDFLRLYLSDEIFAEYQRVSSYGRFKALDGRKVNLLLNQLKRQAEWVATHTFVKAALDEDDNRFLECALKAKAHFLITGNIKHYPAGKFHYTRIVTPNEFLDIVAQMFFE